MLYNKKNQIVGDIFIIPNQAITTRCGFYKDDDLSHFRRFRDGIHRLINEPKDDEYVEVWCTTPGDRESNWSCHAEMPGKENFARFLPASPFKGKREGDKVVISTKWGEVELTLSQLKYRYRDYGPFEEVMEKLLSH